MISRTFLLSLFVLLSLGIAVACGPYFPSAVFTLYRLPCYPLNGYARGNVGVLQPTFARSYLVVAYRYLSGRPLSREEQQAVLSLWNDRLSDTYTPSTTSERFEDLSRLWVEARKKAITSLVTPPLRPNPYAVQWSAAGYWVFQNLTEDGQRTAINTLNQRVEMFGPNSREVRVWLEGQDSVLASGYRKLAMPPPTPDDIHTTIKRDRSYQIAAALFYAGEYRRAEKAFREISRDSTSSWRYLAGYLVVRAMVRDAQTEDDWRTIGWDRKKLSLAEKELLGILKRSDMSSVHSASRDLLNRVAFHLRPEERFKSHARSLMKSQAGQEFKRALGDYLVFFDDVLPEHPSSYLRSRPAMDDLTDWILTFQSIDSTALEHAIERWRKTSLQQWLLAAISHVESQHTAVPELLKAASKIDRSSPAYPGVSYHVARLLIERGRYAEARVHLDTVLSAARKSLSLSTLNAFLTLRARVANSMNEYFAFAVQTPVAVFYDGGFDYDVDLLGNAPRVRQFSNTLFFNTRVPLSTLKDVATNSNLPKEQGRTLALATWVRAVILENHGMASELTPTVGLLVPEIKGYLSQYLGARDDRERRFAAAFLMLHFPGLHPYLNPEGEFRLPINRIDDLRDNWWCVKQYGYTPGWLRGKLWEHKSEDEHYPAILSDEEKRQAKEELKQLESGSNGPNYLCAQVLEWGKEHPRDQRVPEALHLAVKSTRFGCTDSASGKFSKQAFRLLHKNYPQSEWANKTPYWFKD